ncbi:hypothetical protein Tco_1033064 [Tanacetum coccineum]|uniref:Uncharacterized protein n=1 Tax=Tanacetum coccineum TaxID=301880 RepID=A0ABQ5GG18_9ASTR
MSTHPIIILSDFDVEDTFSSTNTLDYTPASSDYSSASPGNTSSDPSDGLSKDLLASLPISPINDYPYMMVMQAYNATSNESPIPPPRALIAPPTILPSSSVLPPSPLFDSPEISFSQGDFLHLINDPIPITLLYTDTSAPPHVFEIGENSHMNAFRQLQ